jgi:hypothetical protein
VAGGSGADSMLRFRLKRRGNRMKHYRKMKQRQRARPNYIERKCDMVRCCGDIGQRRRHWGGEREETTSVGLT